MMSVLIRYLMEIDMNITATLTARIASYANQYGYSDVEPYEIVRVVSDKTIEIRSMNAERSLDWKPEIIPGGFAGHCVNQDEQRWIITPRPDAPVKRIRLGKKGWRDKYGSCYYLSTQPRKFYDYNF